MKSNIILSLLLVFALSAATVSAKSPIYGRIKVKGTKLYSQNGRQVQLKGIATHGIHWNYNFYKDGKAIDAAISDWGANLVRITNYLYEGGYIEEKVKSKEDLDDLIDSIVKLCIKKRVYCIIDWHVHKPGDPAVYLEDAKVFFNKMAKKYGRYPNVLFEICNEPNPGGYGDVKGHYVTWAEIKDYAAEIIPIIRKFSNNIIIVGTPSYSSLGLSHNEDWRVIAKDPIKEDNIVYAIHFYASGHGFYKKVEEASKKLPLFASEWAVGTWEPQGENNLDKAKPWLEFLKKNKISWAYWSYSPGEGNLCTFKPGVTSTDDLSPTGKNVNGTGKILYNLLQEK